MKRFAVHMRATWHATITAPIVFCLLSFILDPQLSYDRLLFFIVITALFGFVCSYTCLMFLEPLFHRVCSYISMCSFLIVGTVAGTLIILWPSSSFRGFNDEAMQTASGIMNLSFPYAFTGGICSLAAWYCLYKHYSKK